MKQPLQTSTLLELIRLFENSSAFTDRHGQRLFGIPMWDIKKSVLTPELLANWSYHAGYATVYPVQVESGTLLVDIEEGMQVESYYYRSPETHRRYSVDLHQLTIFNIAEDKLLRYLAELFEVPEALQDGILDPVIAETLWHLGKCKIGERWIDIWCARQLATQTALVFQQLKKPHHPEAGILVSLSPTLPDPIVTPRQYRVMTLRNLLVRSVRTPLVDRDLLHRLLEDAPLHTNIQDKNGTVRYDSYSHTLKILTRPIAPWVLKGKHQRMVVEYLYQQLQKGRRWVPAQDILHHVYGNRNFGHSRRLKDIFRGSLHWKDYITMPQKGVYGFRLE